MLCCTGRPEGRPPSPLADPAAACLGPTPHTAFSLPQGGAVRSVMTATLGTLWGSLGLPSPAGGASAVGTWTPTPWATATPCLATACVACTTRQVPTVSAVRKASTGAPWPLGPQTDARVSTHLPPHLGGGWGALYQSQAAALGGWATSGRFLTFSVPLSGRSKGLLSSKVKVSLSLDLINADPVIFFFFCLDNLALHLKPHS